MRHDTNSPEFRRAWKYLNNQAPIKPKNIDRMITLLRSIYYENKTITDADHYYSPSVQKRRHQKHPEKCKEIPIWVADGFSSKTLIEVFIPGLKFTDDFRFFKRIY